MTERQKAIEKVLYVMDLKDKGEPSDTRDWRIDSAARYLWDYEQEQIKKNIESNGNDH